MQSSPVQPPNIWSYPLNLSVMLFSSPFDTHITQSSMQHILVTQEKSTFHDTKLNLSAKKNEWKGRLNSTKNLKGRIERYLLRRTNRNVYYHPWKWLVKFERKCPGSSNERVLDYKVYRPSVQVIVLLKCNYVKTHFNGQRNKKFWILKYGLNQSLAAEKHLFLHWDTIYWMFHACKSCLQLRLVFND